MENSINIAKWFIHNNNHITNKSTDTNIKLQKLLYYSQAMHLAVMEEPLFNEQIEAWRYGPVVREAYISFEHNNLLENVKTGQTKADLSQIKPIQLQILKTVNFIYGNKSSSELVNLSHDEEPWDSLKEKVARQENPIIEEEILSSYYRPLREVFESYRDFDFEAHAVENINGNRFVYNVKNTDLSDVDVLELWQIGAEQRGESFFVYKENGELVVY